VAVLVLKLPGSQEEIVPCAKCESENYSSAFLFSINIHESKKEGDEGVGGPPKEEEVKP
jgi:hypothetical protein